jgi:hypothetical protein
MFVVVSGVSKKIEYPTNKVADSARKSGLKFKVETPIHDNTRKLVTWECKEHGVES